MWKVDVAKRKKNAEKGARACVYEKKVVTLQAIFRAHSLHTRVKPV